VDSRAAASFTEELDISLRSFWPFENDAMTTATIPPAASPPPSGVAKLYSLVNLVEPGERLLITGVRYADFMRLAEWRDDAHRYAVRLAYDHEKLEIMVVTNPHERFRKIIALLIETWIEETGGDYLPSGQLTHRREDLKRGFEPDECYYIQNWKKVAGIREIDFTRDPPPDLCVEAEVSRTLLERLPIYAAFKIPEVWRYNGERLLVLHLQVDGSYQESSISRALPTLPLAELPRFLSQAEDLSTSFAAISRQFREWIHTLSPTTPKN
jgi:Uma2 family endonuclease